MPIQEHYYSSSVIHSVSRGIITLPALGQDRLWLLNIWHVGILSVLRIGHPALSKCAAKITDTWFDSQRLQQLINDLFDTKLACSKAGIANRNWIYWWVPGSWTDCLRLLIFTIAGLCLLLLVALILFIWR